MTLSDEILNANGRESIHLKCIKVTWKCPGGTGSSGSSWSSLMAPELKWHPEIFKESLLMKIWWNIANRLSKNMKNLFIYFPIFWKVLVKCIFCHISGTSEDIESILVANYLLMIQHLHFGGSWIWDLWSVRCHTRNLLEVAGDVSGEPGGVEPNGCWDMIGYHVGYQNPKFGMNRSRQWYFIKKFRKCVIFKNGHFFALRICFEDVFDGEDGDRSILDHFHSIQNIRNV